MICEIEFVDLWIRQCDLERVSVSQSMIDLSTIEVM